ncbi:MAG: hypothetical protein IH622_13605 [Ochrobactrum anthropi]|uniref:Uncharacterized protein n=1 Tax=Brucella anthropi TaxID=529 RepID=A0A8I0N771_BRUAN|nr:hypothetical protein [Brucella anthropi]MBE0561833.1 hypothetical protein [Brucella anthropi]
MAKKSAVEKIIDRAIARVDVGRRKRELEGLKRAAETRRRRDKQEKYAARERLAAEVKSGTRGLNERIAQLPGWQMLLVRMEPGRWYTYGELVKLMPEYSYNSLKVWTTMFLVKRGLVDRANNPDWKYEQTWKSLSDPRYVYRVAHSATEQRAEWLREVLECDGTREG